MRRKTVLIVDASPLIRTILTRRAESEGWRSRQAPSNEAKEGFRNRVRP